jgi:PPK2 family polyphosphate:nucleotide phosphotransferase
VLTDRFLVDPDHFRLADHDPGDTGGLKHKEAEGLLAEDIEEMVRLQDRLYADGRYALLLVLQAPDAAGKDGVIKHVMSGVNPAGCQVHSFKAPSSTELRHDYLWRCACRLPERGHIGIFNRSYYEEVLVVRVHPGLLEAQRLPPGGPAGDAFWRARFADMVHFEQYLVRNGIRVLKFFLNVSREEQRRRFLKRIDDPTKNWKMSEDDYRERQHWDDYQAAYEDTLRHTSTAEAPWYAIPADHKWFTRLAVARIIVAALRELDPNYPEVSGQQKKELARIRELLEKEG